MNKYFRLICIFICVVISFFVFTSSTKTDEVTEINQNGYDITRVHYDMMYDMKIYRVKTPNGVYTVLWEESKGGLCVLK